MNNSTKQNHTKASGNIKKDGMENCKSHRMGKFCLRWCLSAMSEYIPTKSHQHDCTNMSMSEHGQQPSTCESEWETLEASILHKELQTTGKC